MEPTCLTEIVFPQHLNHHGTLFGGQALLMLSKAAFLAARSWSGNEVVMAACSGAQFRAPVALGSVLRLTAWVTRAGRSSMTVRVEAHSASVGQDAVLALEASFEMVAVDPQGRPVAMAVGLEAGMA